MKAFPRNLFIIGILLASCKQPAPARPAAEAVPADSVKSYLPVADLLKEDIRAVDSFAGGILLKSSLGKKQDSAFITPARFHALSQTFLPPGLDQASFQQHFTETSLMDETTGLLQFIYTPVGEAGDIHRVVVYVNPGQTSNNVNRIYLEKGWKQNDTIVEQKLTWRLKKYFIIASLREPAPASGNPQVQRVIWDPQEFADE